MATCTDATAVWRLHPGDTVASVLASVLGTEADSIDIDRACRHCGDPGHGKPRVVGQHAIDFSASTSRGVTLVAVTTAGTVGVDVERLRAIRAPERMAARYFDPVEASAVVADDQPAERFLRQWVRKEAFLKALGVGIVRGMRWFAIERGDSSDDDDSLRVWVRGAPDERWQVRDLDAGPGVVAALAFKPA